jgi:hypothetical protein
MASDDRRENLDIAIEPSPFFGDGIGDIGQALH